MMMMSAPPPPAASPAAISPAAAIHLAQLKTLVKDPVHASSQFHLPPNLSPWFLGPNSLKDAVAAYTFFVNEASKKKDEDHHISVVSYDLRSVGGTKLYHVTRNVAQFDRDVQETVPDPCYRNAYEVLTEQQRVKAYFDLEYYSSAVTELQLQEARRDFITLLTIIKTTITKACVALLGLIRPNIIFLDGSRASHVEFRQAQRMGIYDDLLKNGAVPKGQQLPCHKFSCHIIIYNAIFEFNTHPALRFFVERAVPSMAEIAPHLQWLPQQSQQQATLDLKVYGRFQNFRMPDCCKRGTDVSLTRIAFLSDGDARTDALITHVPGYAPTSSIGSTFFVTEPSARYLPAAANAASAPAVQKHHQLHQANVKLISENRAHKRHRSQYLYNDPPSPTPSTASSVVSSSAASVSSARSGSSSSTTRPITTSTFDSTTYPQQAAAIVGANLFDLSQPEQRQRLILLQRAVQHLLRSYGDTHTDVQSLADVYAEGLRFQCNHYGKGRPCLLSRTDHGDNNCLLFAEIPSATITNMLLNNDESASVPILLRPLYLIKYNCPSPSCNTRGIIGEVAWCAASGRFRPSLFFPPRLIRNPEGCMPRLRPLPASIIVANPQYVAHAPLTSMNIPLVCSAAAGRPPSQSQNETSSSFFSTHLAGVGEAGGGNGSSGDEGENNEPAPPPPLPDDPPPPPVETGQHNNDNEPPEDEEETYNHMNPNEADESDNYYPMVKRRFEAYVFQVDNPVGYVFLGYNQHDKHIQLLKRMELVNHFESVYFIDPEATRLEASAASTTQTLTNRKPFVPMWLKDPKKKKKLEIVYVPGATPLHVYNSWGGFYADRLPPIPPEQVEGLVAPLVSHIRTCIANDKEPDLLYVLRWLAQIVRYPCTKTQVALFLYGVEGCGKNLVFDLMQSILGPPNGFQTSSPERDIFGTFTTAFDKAILIQTDEVKRCHDYENLFKDYVTGETVRSEHKGKDAKTVVNRANFVFTSNTEGVFRISPFDRRCVLFNCSARFVGNEAYFHFLQNYRRKPEIIRAFYQYLREFVDLPEHFQFQYNRPKTEFYKEQQKLCICPLDQFLSSVVVEYESNRLLSNRQGLACLKFKQSLLWKMFQKFIEISGEKFEGKQNTFTKTLLKKKGIKVVHESVATSYIIDVPVMKAEMVANRVFDEDAMWIVE